MKAKIALLLLLTFAFACPPNCEDCDPAGITCSACSEGYEIDATSQCIMASIVPNCILYSPSGICFNCQPTLSLYGAVCNKVYTGCLILDPADGVSCQTCGFGTVLQNKQCIGSINCASATNPCPSCIPGFVLQNGKCVDQSGNCQTVGSNGICTICRTGFDLIGYSCISHAQRVYACYIYGTDGVCQFCKTGYNLYQGNCLLPSQIQQIQQGITTL